MDLGYYYCFYLCIYFFIMAFLFFYNVVKVTVDRVFRFIRQSQKLNQFLLFSYYLFSYQYFDRVVEKDEDRGGKVGERKILI